MKKLIVLCLCLILVWGCSKKGADLVIPIQLDPSEIVADFTKDHYIETSPWSAEGYPDARSSDMADFQFKNAEQMEKISFDSKTVWANQLPFGFEPEKILKINKNPGLGLKELHKEGYTGKGINVAIVDQGLLTDHVEYKNRLVYYKNLNDTSGEASMHGAAVASILAGKTLGVAPECNLYYVSYNTNLENDETSALGMVQGVQYILDLNETLPEKDKIQVISLSRNFVNGSPYYQEFLAVKKRAEENGMFLFTVQTPMDKYCFAGLKKESTANPDNFQAYRPIDRMATDYWKVSAVYVPEANITTASPTGIEDYVFYGYSGISWAVPYYAGCYALALQADTTITPEGFYQLAIDTGIYAQWKEDGAEKRIGPILNPRGIIEVLKSNKK